MADADEKAIKEPHVAVVKKFFDQAVKYSRSGVFQLKKSASALGVDLQELTVNAAGWLDFCSAHQVRRRFRIVEADLRDIFDMCKNRQSNSAETLTKDQFQQALIMLGSKVGLHAAMTAASPAQVSHGAAFNSLVGVIVMLQKEFEHEPDPWKPLLSIIPKMKTLFQKVAKNTKDPIGSLGKSGSLVSCREFVCFYEEQSINQKFDADISNSRLMAIFRKSQITANSEKSQCDLKEFSYAIMLLAIELRALSALNLEFYGDSEGGVHSIFDHCDPETGLVLSDFVQKLLGSTPKSDDILSTTKSNAGKKYRQRHVSLLGESGKSNEQEHNHRVAVEPVLSVDYDEPDDGTLSTKKIREIVSKGYIYRRSKNEAYVADAGKNAFSAESKNDVENANIEEVDFNPILQLLEDDCIELAVQVEEHQMKEIIQCLRRNAFRKHLALKIQGNDQSTSANSVASIVELIIQRVFTVSDNATVSKSLNNTLDKRWKIGQRGTICKVGIYQLSVEIVYELVDEAVSHSIQHEHLVETLRQEQLHKSGLIWNRTSPGWRYFRAMHVYEDLYTDQTLPEIDAVNELHATTKDYYSQHIERVVRSHKLKSATKVQRPGSMQSSPSRVTTPLMDGSLSMEHASSDHLESDSGLAVSWKLRQRVQEDCASPTRWALAHPVEISPDEFDLKLSPHLSTALKHSDRQQKDQHFLAAIKQQAKSINDATIANYSVPSKTYLMRQKNKEMQELNERKTMEAKDLADRQALRKQQVAEHSKSNRAESAIKFMDEQSKVEQAIQEGKRVAEIARHAMEQKREEITGDRISVIRNAFDSDSRAGRKVVCGFSGKMQRLPSTIDQFEAKMVLYTSSPVAMSPIRSPISSPNKQLSMDCSPPSSRPSTSNSNASFMHPKLWSSVVKACSIPSSLENSRPSTSHSQMSPNGTNGANTTTQLSSPVQSFSASVTKVKQRPPSLTSLDRISLFPGINAAAGAAYLN